MASLFDHIAACHRRIAHLDQLPDLLTSILEGHDMLKLLLTDPRIKTARAAVMAKYAAAGAVSPMLNLNILMVLIADFEELAPLIDNPAAFIAELLSLLASTTTPPPATVAPAA